MESIVSKIIFFVLAVIIEVTLVWLGLNRPRFLLDDSQISYVFSTSAQVLAAVFALTIPSYTFFRDRLDDKRIYNECLRNMNDFGQDVIDKIKDKTFRRMVLICTLTFCAEACCLLTISGESLKSHFCKVVYINFTMSLVFLDFFFIIFFIYQMIDPKIYEKTLQSIKSNSKYYSSNVSHSKIKTETKISNVVGENHASNLYLFLEKFNGIENKLRRFEDKYFYNHRRNSLTFIVKMIYENKIISKKLYEDLIELIYFRNRAVHGEKIDVPSFAVQKIEELTSLYEEAMEEWNSRKKR